MRHSRAAGIAFAVLASILTIDRAGAGSPTYWSDVEGSGIFEAALAVSGLRPQIGPGEAFTLFLPSDEALEQEGSAVLLRGVYTSPINRARLADLLAYHIVPGRKIDLPSRQADSVMTMSGDPLSFGPDGDRLLVNGHISVIRSVDLGDGIVHLVSGLLWADLMTQEKDVALGEGGVPANW